MQLPTVETLILQQSSSVLKITLNRPGSRNAMSLQMVQELMAVFDSISNSTDIRIVVLRGVQGNFCSGGDIKDMVNARSEAGEKEQEGVDPFYVLNRQFGRLITQVNSAPQVVVAVLEGAVLGGGFGLACVSDVAIAAEAAKFGLPESSLGIPPAQIAPFVVARIGLTQARRLALLGVRFNGIEAKQLGIVHYLCQDTEAIEETLQEVIAQAKRCAPKANVITKNLMLAVGTTDLDTLLDAAAEQFSKSVQSEEGTEGTMAFIEKRLPAWAQEDK
jgi:isohexenylglutaconyl-CoA hydratase